MFVKRIVFLCKHNFSIFIYASMEDYVD